MQNKEISLRERVVIKENDVDKEYSCILYNLQLGHNKMYIIKIAIY